MRRMLVTCLGLIGAACAKPEANAPGATASGAQPSAQAESAMTTPPPPLPGQLGAATPCPDGATPGGDGVCPGAAPAAPAQGTSSTTPQKPRSAAVEQLARGTGTAADTKLAEGDAALEADDYDNAAKHYGEAKRLAPEDPAPLVGLARVALRRSGIELGYASAPKDPQVQGVLRTLDRALRLDPRFAPALLERGRALLILGEAEPALSALRGAAKGLPHDAEAQSALGVALLATGAPGDALQHFQRASQLDPNNPERLTNLGTAYMMRGRVPEAVRAYRRAVALDPSDPRTQGDLGTAYLAQHDLDSAMVHLEKAVALDPRATFLSNLGYAYQLLGMNERAVSTYRRALDKDPKLGSAWINLGTVLAQQGKLAEAEKALKEAERLDPSDPRAKANLEELEALKRKGASQQSKP
jgi:tetratricopeptide (TPR) repeat protein